MSDHGCIEDPSLIAKLPKSAMQAGIQTRNCQKAVRIKNIPYPRLRTSRLAHSCTLQPHVPLGLKRENAFFAFNENS
jgi:hypothetical protein